MKKNKNNFKIIFQYIKKYKIQLIFISILIFISNLNYILTGYLNGAAIESVVKLDIKKSILFLVIYFIIETSVEIISRIAYYFLVKIQTKISRQIGYDTYQKVMKLPAYAFEELSSGEIINRVTNDTEVIANSMNTLLNIVSNIITTFLILIYIFFNSWIVGIEILIFLSIYVFVVKYFTKEVKKWHKKNKEQNDKYTALATESVRGIREIKTLGITNQLLEKVSDIIKKLYNISIKENKTYTKYDSISTFLKEILEVGTFITCAILVYYGEVTITFFVAMTYYIYRYTWLIENITEFSKTYERLTVSLERINEILSNKRYPDVCYGEVTLENPKGIIEFKNINFHYKNEDMLLKNFNIKFEPNQKIAIVGSSGEGKSTLFNLITRIFDPIDGNIYLDDINIADLTEESLRKNIAIIRQEPFLFNRTILENFELLDPKISLEEVRKYCKIAYIDDYIMSLPKGYNTLLGEGGINLSGGQKQRLSIARTLLKKSKIILFDEATSALDNESQEYIKQAIDKLSKDHTVLIVAHRLSTIIDANIIYVMKNGKIIAQGTHKKLMEECEFYQKLYMKEGQIK